jgi:hypothetical protein
LTDSYIKYALTALPEVPPRVPASERIGRLFRRRAWT